MELELEEKQTRLAKRQKEGVSKKLAPSAEGAKKPPPKVGGTRQPKTVKKGMKPKFGETHEKEKAIEEVVRGAIGNMSLPAIPVEIRIKNEPSEPTKVDVDVHIKTPESNEEVIEEKIKTEREKQETERKKQEAAESVKEKAEKS